MNQEVVTLEDAFYAIENTLRSLMITIKDDQRIVEHERAALAEDYARRLAELGDIANTIGVENVGREPDPIWTCPKCYTSLLQSGIDVWDLVDAKMVVTFKDNDPENQQWTGYEEYGEGGYTIAMHCGSCHDPLPHKQAVEISRRITQQLYTVTAVPVDEEN